MADVKIGFCLEADYPCQLGEQRDVKIAELEERLAKLEG